MNLNLWYSIGHYFIGIILVLALLFALMEASRKYDRFRHRNDLALAIGYFLLVTWALLRSLSLNQPIITILLTISQIGGFLALALGYFPGQADEIENEEKKPQAIPAPEVKFESLDDNSPKKGWIALLAARPEGQVVSQVSEDSLSLQEQVETTAKPAENKIQKTIDLETPTKTHEKTTDKPKVKKAEVKKELVADSQPEIDLSYLAKRQINPKPEAIKPATQTKESAITNKEPENPAKPKKSRKTKNTPTSDANKLTAETKEEILDELFPIKPAEESEPIVSEKKTELSTNLLPGEERELSKNNEKVKHLPAGLLLTPLTFNNLGAHLPEILIITATIIVIVRLASQRGARGSNALLFGFLLIALSQLGYLLYGPLTDLGTITTTQGFIAGLATAAETVGLPLLGVSGWQKIKGKVTHHFLTVISLVYLSLLLLTLTLAQFIVKDAISLQLLLFLVTGILIVILPIIHSLAYNHPHTTDNNLAHHE